MSFNITFGLGPAGGVNEIHIDSVAQHIVTIANIMNSNTNVTFGIPSTIANYGVDATTNFIKVSSSIDLNIEADIITDN